MQNLNTVHEKGTTHLGIASIGAHGTSAEDDEY